MFKLTFTANSIAADDRKVLGDILRNVADNWEDGGTQGPVRDVNGVIIGSWELRK